MAKIGIVVGSTRQGRQSDKLAKWVATEVSKHAEAQLLDLRDYPMPFYDEPGSARYMPERKPAPEIQKWLDAVAGCDGFVFVTPEYNRTTSAVLKNAIDVIGHEIDDKPVALVGHGSSGGAQAIASLRMAVPGIGAVTIPQALFFSDHLADSISDEGELKPEIAARPYGPQATLEAQIASLLWYVDALNAARQQ